MRGRYFKNSVKRIHTFSIQRIGDSFFNLTQTHTQGYDFKGRDSIVSQTVKTVHYIVRYYEERG